MICCYQNKKTKSVFILIIIFLCFSFTNAFAQSPTYCAAPGSNCSFFDQLSNVKIGTLDNNSACSQGGYSDYTTLVAPQLNRGSAVPISVTIGAGGNDTAVVWIDYNQNGNFEVSEYTLIGGASSSNDVIVTKNINIPNDAIEGITRMRVRVKFSNSSTDAPWTANDACTAFQYGETEDYNININATCTYPSVPTLSPDTVLCGSGGSATLRITGGSLNDATEWKWYAAGCGTGTALATGTTLTVTPTATTTYYVRGEGGCATESNCGNVTITVSTVPAPPTIDSIGATCLNSTQLLNINPVSTFRGAYTVSSGTVNISIPDNTADGVTSSLAVANNPIPAGAVVESFEVKLNMTHSYPGDMIFNLKAPNGKILNLYKYGGGLFTGNDGDLPGAGWFNAVVSSTATIPFSSVTTGYAYGSAATPGPFQADALNTAVEGPDVQNPTGYASNAAGFADATTILPGTWTLAMADGGPLDFGVLEDWSITIRYAISTQSYPAKWAPASTLYTDANATVPYNGITPRFTVYAKPSANTTYTAVSVNAGCISDTSRVVVVINNPVSVSSSPSNDTICEFGITKFSAAANGTTPSYQWQVNTGSGTYIAISNSGNYSGVTTDTLTVSNAPASWNGYQYRCLFTSAAPCVSIDSTTAATLTINPTPVISLNASPLTRLLPGLTTILTATSTPAAADYIWYKNNLEITGLTTGSFTAGVEDLGDYKVSVTDINGCSGTSALLSVTDSVSGKLFIYPNPNRGQFNVSYYSLAGNSPLPRTVIIYDAKGAVVYNKTYSITKPYDKMDVNLTSFGKGVYIIQLLDVTGKRLAVGKVVVQ